jgi:hypothetical protein
MVFPLAVAVAAALTAPPQVAIELGELGAPAGARVVESCERALGKGRCVAAISSEVLPPPSAVEADPPTSVERPPEAPAPSAVVDSAPPPPNEAAAPSGAPFRARLTWDGTTLQVELFAGAGGERVAESNVHFSDTDDEQQRWIAAGLLVASLAAAQAGETTAPLVPSAPPPRESQPPPVEKAPEEENKRVVESQEIERLRFDLSLFAAPGFDEGPMRMGYGAASEFVSESVPLGARLSLRYADAAPNVAGAQLSSLSATLGLVACLTGCHGDNLLEVSGEAVGERALVTVERDGESEKRSAFRFGGRAGLTFAHKVTEGLGFFVGGDVTWLRPELAVTVDSKAAGAESAWRWGISAGARFFVPGT